jgi:hypothetical protein
MNLVGRSSMVGVGSVAAPVAIYLFLKVTIGLGPSPSPAQPADPTASLPPPPPPAVPLTAEQTRALEWLASLRIDATLPSPLEHAEVVHQDVPEAPVVPEVDPLEGLRLSALMGSGASQIASISGKIYRIGDTVVPGFTVRTIDTAGQRVELVAPDGTSRWIEREQ